MNVHKWFLRVAVVLSLAFVGVGTVVGLPTGSATITPSVSATGGAGPLKISVDTSAVTSARVDDGGDPDDPTVDPEAVTIGYNSADSAEGEDTCTFVGTATQPDAGCGIRWVSHLAGNCNVRGFTVNAPGDLKAGSYSTDNEARVWGTYSTSIAGAPETSAEGEARVTISNNSSGDLADVDTMELGTASVPFITTGDPNENYSVTLTYSGRAAVALKAHRPEVEVGGLAFAGDFTGSISAFQVAPGGAETLLKKANGVDDAIWELK